MRCSQSPSPISSAAKASLNVSGSPRPKAISAPIKGRKREVGAGTGRPKMTEGKHEKNEADPDHEEPEDGSESGDTSRRQPIAEPKSARHVRRSSSKALDHCNRDGVG